MKYLGPSAVEIRFRYQAPCGDHTNAFEVTVGICCQVLIEFLNCRFIEGNCGRACEESPP